jgi:hypothetical protein
MNAHSRHTCRHTAAVAALALVLTGLAGCAAGPVARPGEAALQTMTPVTSTASEPACVEFACEP